MIFLPPANEVWGKVIFLHLFVILFTGGACVVAPGEGGMRGCSGGGMHGCSGGVCGCSGGSAWLFGGCAWLLGGCAWLLQGGWGACVVALGGYVWLLGGRHTWLLQGVCVVAQGGVRGCLGGCAWLLWGGMHGCSGGACMVARGGHVWLLQGGRVWLLLGGHAWDMTRYGDTINERAVCILLECILVERKILVLNSLILIISLNSMSILFGLKKHI